MKVLRVGGVQCAVLNSWRGHVELGWKGDGWGGGGVAADEGSGVVAAGGFGEKKSKGG